MLITFCVSRRPRKMYCCHARLCVCVSVCVSSVVRRHYCTDPDVTWGRGRGCPLVVHYWADLQSGHGLHCYGNITRTLVTSLCPSRDMTTQCDANGRLGGVCARCWPVTAWRVTGDVLKIARRIWEVAVVGLPVTSRRRGGGCSQHYCGSLDCGLPLVAFWQHNANAKC